MDWIGVLYEIWERPTIGVCSEMILFLGVVWLGFAVGVLVGWAWKPDWESLFCSVAKPFCLSWEARSIVPPMKGFGSASRLDITKLPSSSCEALESSPNEYEDCSTSQVYEERPAVMSLVTEKDLELLCQLVEVKDGGPAWIQMMDRSTAKMHYQAWRRDHKTAPSQYRTRTVFEDATPEMVRDFFWDDEFRPKWDDMLADASLIEECTVTGTMVVRWIRKFPFFCNDREYIIGRRIWKSGRSYYCVTKGVECPSVTRSDNPRRVDIYYSSWCIRAVESIRDCSQLTACEVLLFHHEDTGLPWEITKLGVRQGMWGTVKRIESGLRAYQKERASGAPLSHSALAAQINTIVDPDYLRCLGNVDNSVENETVTKSKNPFDLNFPKLLVFGGIVVLACSLDRALLNKTFIFGLARRLANIGKR